MTTAMETTTPLKNMVSCYFVIFITHSTCPKTANYPGTKLVGVAFELRKKFENQCCVHVLHKTLNLVISHCCFAEDGKEMCQNLKCTCRAIVFLIKPIVLRRCRCRRRCCWLSSLFCN